MDLKSELNRISEEITIENQSGHPDWLKLRVLADDLSQLSRHGIRESIIQRGCTVVKVHGR